MIKWLNKSIIRRYIISYLLISLLPVIFLSILFIKNNIISLQQEQNLSSSVKLNNIKDDLDLGIKSMETFAAHFSAFIIGASSDASIQGCLSTDEVCQQLKKYQEEYPLATEVIYFPRGSASVYTTDEKVLYNDFQARNVFGSELDMIGFYKMLSSISKNALLTTRRVGEQESGNYLIFLCPVPPINSSAIGTMAFIIDNASYNSVVTNYLGEEMDGCFVMYDQSFHKNYALFYENFEIDYSMAVPALAKVRGTGVVPVKIDGEKYIAVRSVSKSYGYTYVYATKEKNFYKDVWLGVNFFLVVTSVAVIMVVVLIIFAAILNLKPIRRLAEDFGDTDPNDGDIFDKIRKGYKRVVNEKDNLVVQINNHNMFARNYLLENLLEGKFESEQKLKLYLLRANINFEKNGFFVVIATLYSNDNREGLASEAVQYLLEIHFKGQKVFGIEGNDPNTIAFLVNTEYPTNENKLLIRQSIGEAIRLRLQECGFHCHGVGVGRIKKDILLYDISYYEALTSVQNSDKPVSLFTKSNDEVDGYSCPVEKCAMFKQSILHGNEETALELLELMFSDMRRKNLEFSTERFFCYYISNTLIEIRNNLKSDIDTDILARSSAHATSAEFYTLAIEYVKQLTTFAAREIESTKESLNSLLLEYVDNHFCDYDISVETISGMFNLSESYVRKIIKEETGYQFNNYITEKRLNFVKSQLVNTDIPVKDIIASVGYSDASSFIRKFKVAEGMTPGQYRTLYCDTKL